MQNLSQSNSKWQQILINALNTPGILSKAYAAFHNYSCGNQAYAMFQCMLRDIQPGPINTYQGWIKLGRQVRRGEKALELCMPLNIKKQKEGEEKPDRFTLFTFKRNWFVLSQTDGEDTDFPGTPLWDKQTALSALGISQPPFVLTNGNVQGFAREKSIAVSPLAALPHKTTFHELGHVVLGHTSENSFSDGELTPKNLAEVEAESVALILCETLNLTGADFARGYIQNWLGTGNEIPERSAQKIFTAADKILKAGELK